MSILLEIPKPFEKHVEGHRLQVQPRALVFTTLALQELHCVQHLRECHCASALDVEAKASEVAGLSSRDLPRRRAAPQLWAHSIIHHLAEARLTRHRDPAPRHRHRLGTLKDRLRSCSGNLVRRPTHLPFFYHLILEALFEVGNRILAWRLADELEVLGSGARHDLRLQEAAVIIVRTHRWDI